MILDGTTTAILKQVESLGYAVIIRNDGTVMIAVKSDDSSERREASDADPYRCACQLAELVGIDLEDG